MARKPQVQPENDTGPSEERGPSPTLAEAPASVGYVANRNFACAGRVFAEGKPVEAADVPEDQWDSLLHAQLIVTPDQR